MTDETTVDTGVAPDTAAPVDNAPAPVQSEDDRLGAVFDRMTRDNGSNRGPDGRFTSPSGAHDPAAASDGEGAGDGSAAVPPLAGLGSPAPEHLPASIKKLWDKLEAPDRDGVSSWLKEQDSKFGQLGDQIKHIKPIADRLNEVTSRFEEFRGMSSAQVADSVMQLAAVQSALGRDPVNTLIEVAQAYNVLPQLAQMFRDAKGDEGAAPAPESQRVIASLERKIADLETRLTKAANPETVRTEISRTMQEKDAERVMQEFVGGKGKEYWADVEAKLPVFINMVLESGGRGRPMTDILSDAYEMAINAIPEVRAKVRASEAKATAAIPDPKQAESARRAASINVRAAANGKDKPMTEEEAMGAAYDRMTAH